MKPLVMEREKVGLRTSRTVLESSDSFILPAVETPLTKEASAWLRIYNALSVATPIEGD
jgi:hypothetical protein